MDGFIQNSSDLDPLMSTSRLSCIDLDLDIYLVKVAILSSVAVNLILLWQSSTFSVHLSASVLRIQRPQTVVFLRESRAFSCLLHSKAARLTKSFVSGDQYRPLAKGSMRIASFVLLLAIE